MGTQSIASSNSAKEKLIADFKMVGADAEDFIKATASQAEEHISMSRDKVQSSLREAKQQLARVEEAILEKSKHAVKVADVYVHENPWKVIGIACGAGLLAGLLLSRR